jgi:16S rRNA (cytidine1402-2'-O)-methyltransferase
MLYVVPTPIGNLEDVTLRSLRVLKETEIIVCEDPRQSTKLFDLLKIPRNSHRFIPITKNHQLNPTIKLVLQENQTADIALVSDAGMPMVSDPGFEVLSLARSAGHQITALPGADSLTTAVAASGLVSKEFRFVGFPPIKKGRNKWWQEISQDKNPIVIFESVHRLPKTLEDIQQVFAPDRPICICKDLSKMHENIWIGNTSDLPNYQFTGKGEYVIVIGRG